MLWYQQVLLVNDPAQVIPAGMNYVDVRDVAEGHIRALEVEEAGGERFLITSRASLPLPFSEYIARSSHSWHSEWCTWKYWSTYG